jgi:hypothetical protein
MLSNQLAYARPPSCLGALTDALTSREIWPSRGYDDGYFMPRCLIPYVYRRAFLIFDSLKTIKKRLAGQQLLIDVHKQKV